MVFKKFESKLIFRVILLLITASLPTLAWVNGLPELLVFLAPILFFQVAELIRFQKRIQEDLYLFTESIHYRDFSRFFNEKNTTEEVKRLRKAFNDINATIKEIAREKEIQHQHLQQILELINTGIITFDIKSGEILLMNEAIKKLLQVPLISNINSLAKRDKILYTQLQALKPGETKIVTIQPGLLDQNPVKVLLTATIFQSEGHTYKLAGLQNVNEALDETESKAWEKLLNVLTHEIMNSIAPISSLADTLKARLQEIEITQISGQDIEDMEEGVGTIKRRSEGLLRFAETYRNLSKITKLNIEQVYLKDLFGNLQRLMQPTLAQKKIDLNIFLKEPEIYLQADPSLLDQVLINLLVNAIDAVKEQPEPAITLSAYTANDKVVIKIADNGIGIRGKSRKTFSFPSSVPKSKAVE